MDCSFGIKLPGLVPTYAATFRELPSVVAQLERIGFDDVMDGEHILFAPVMHHPGGAGNMVHGRDSQRSDRADTLVMFGAISAVTTRIKMVSSVILGAAHTYAVLARQAATLDVLSNGRFSLGVGSGWFAGEFAAMGIPPKERDARLEDTIRACRVLWEPGLGTYDGTWIKFTDVITEPAPVTPGGVPVWWGGNALAGPTARRVAEFCAGWISREAADYDEIAGSVDRIRAACAEFGRDPSGIGFRASLIETEQWQAAGSFDGLVEQCVANARRLTAVGVTHFNFPLNYYRLDFDQLALLLAALRAA